MFANTALLFSKCEVPVAKKNRKKKTKTNKIFFFISSILKFFRFAIRVVSYRLSREKICTYDKLTIMKVSISKVLKISITLECPLNSRIFEIAGEILTCIVRQDFK